MLCLLFLLTANIPILDWLFQSHCVFRSTIIVIKTTLAVYWLVSLNFCVFVCQGSWILATGRVFLNDGTDREEEYKIEAWGDLKSPFCNIIFTLTLEPKGLIPPQPQSASFSVLYCFCICSSYCNILLLLISIPCFDHISWSWQWNQFKWWKSLI